MEVPKIIFRDMTLEENIEIIKWAYFEDNEAINIHKYVIQYFPQLANIDKSLPKAKIYKIIEEVVTNDYEIYKDRIISEVKRYNDIWNKYNNVYFEAISKYLNISWPNDRKIIDASVGLIPIFPRYLDTFSFALATGVDKWKLIEVAAHETLHFLWFEKWKLMYPECPRREFDSPYVVWQYSEMVTDPILNSKEIKSVLNIDERAYDSFYEIVDENSTLMDNLKGIYASNKSIEEKITLGYDYVKNILKSKEKLKRRK